MRDNFGGLNWDRSFNVGAEIESIAHMSKLRRRPRFKRTPVDRYRGELVALYAAGLSFAQLALWLRSRKRVKVSRSAVQRRMRQWPEVNIRRSRG